MKRIEDSLVIRAPRDRLWALTVDVERWPAFLTTVRHARLLGPGPIAPGSSARVKQPGQPPAVWTVTLLRPGEEFVWTTRLPIGVTMTASHVLRDAGTGSDGGGVDEGGAGEGGGAADGDTDTGGDGGPGACRNVLAIDLAGRGAGVFGALFGRKIKKAIATENACFKSEAERGA